MSRAKPSSVEADQPGSLFYPQFDSILWSIASTECGEIPSSTNPGISGDDTVSVCIRSTWLRVRGGFGSISKPQASACQTANGRLESAGAQGQLGTQRI
jgi:hypothetical protein